MKINILKLIITIFLFETFLNEKILSIYHYSNERCIGNNYNTISKYQKCIETDRGILLIKKKKDHK
jgi:hypothetical protein